MALAIGSSCCTGPSSARQRAGIRAKLALPGSNHACRSPVARFCSFDRAGQHVVSVQSVNPAQGCLEVAEPQQHSQPSFLQSLITSTARALALAGLVCAVSLGTAGTALAARSGGRVGGTAFGGGRSSLGSSSASRSTFSGSSGFSGSSHSRFGSSMSGPSYMRSASPTVVFTSPTIIPVGGGSALGYTAASSSFSSFLLAMLAVGLATWALVELTKSIRERSESNCDAVPRVTVAKVQVGLLSIARGLKLELDQLAARSETTGSRGLHMLLQEVVLALLRNPDYAAYASCSSKVVEGSDLAESAFAALSLDNRSKFQQETLSNFNGISRSAMLLKDHPEVNELIVVTLLVAAEGDFQLPAIKNHDDLRLALSQLGAITPDSVMGVEVTWTPQADNDALTQQELMSDYPHLVPLL